MKRKRSIREEANALTCHAFRNGQLENLHAGEWSELLEKSGLSRITDAEMKQLMIDASDKLAKVLALKESDPARYWDHIEWVCNTYTKNWVKDDPQPESIQHLSTKVLVQRLWKRIPGMVDTLVSPSDVESALKTVLARKPTYDIESEQGWERLLDDLRKEIKRRVSE